MNLSILPPTIHPFDESNFHSADDNPLLLRTSSWIPIPDNQAELDHLSRGFETFILIFDFFSCITGVIGNMATIMIVAFSKKLRTINNFFVAHLAAIDMIICGVVVPFNIYSIIYTEGHFHHCRVFGPLIIGVMIMSLLSLANIALNRYFMVCKEPHVYAKIYTKRNTALIIIGCYIYTIILLIPPYAGLASWAEHVKFKTCLYAGYDPNAFIYGLGILTTLAFFPSAFACLFSYFWIIRKFKESRAKFSKVSPGTKSSNENEESTKVDESKIEENSQEVMENSPPTSRQRAQSKSDKKTFRTIVGMIMVFVVFLVCWAPVILVFVIDFQGKSGAEIYVSTLGLAWINSSINVVLYATLNSNFREGYKLLFTCKWRELRNH